MMQVQFSQNMPQALQVSRLAQSVSTPLVSQPDLVQFGSSDFVMSEKQEELVAALGGNAQDVNSVEDLRDLFKTSMAQTKQKGLMGLLDKVEGLLSKVPGDEWSEDVEAFVQEGQAAGKLIQLAQKLGYSIESPEKNMLKELALEFIPLPDNFADGMEDELDAQEEQMDAFVFDLGERLELNTESLWEMYDALADLLGLEELDF